MSDFKYRTRGNSSPQGKSKVYFFCHPADFPLYFEEISQDILKCQDCAVWYDGNADGDYEKEELFSMLEQMQLFVIPVTTRFLLQESRAFCVEFPFALERHIPILPLMQENGLESLFNKKCGDLHMFCRKENQSVADYEKKLRRFLSGVLVGDTYAEKIRDAFDAYIFLSYRKKDYKYAQTLMRLIHKNNFCRDIAIWYDEFLTPGENFNEIIARALQKSDLFALVVTPNIIHGQNYVITTEYPMARQEGKPILPMELVPTDLNMLKNKFSGIPECIDADDETTLAEALLEAIRCMDIQKNADSPEHIFFIGLAYLSGIDVEIDHDRALELITSAADAGLPEALHKLVDMYRMGEGVERNCRTAIKWQEKIVLMAEQQYREKKGKADAELFFLELVTMGDYYYEMKDAFGARNCYEKLEVILFEESPEKDMALLTRYDRLASVSRLLGFLTEAELYDRRNLAIFEKMPEQYRNETTYRKAADACYRLVEVLILLEKLGEAEKFCQRGIGISHHLFLQTKENSDLRELATGYQLLGNVCKEKKELSKARNYCLESLAAYETLMEQTRSVQARQDLFAIYGDISDICIMERSLLEAREYCNREFETIREAEMMTIEARRNLAFAYERSGDIFMAEGNQKEAYSVYQQAFDLIQQLIIDVPSRESDNDYASIAFKIGAAFASSEKLEIACKIWEWLSNMAPENPVYQQRLDMAVNEKKRLEAGQKNEMRKWIWGKKK